MPHEATLISTVAVGLAYALVGGYLAALVRLPPLVGYLLAGIVVGPFTPGFVADQQLAPQLAEIGVILLMFGVGMHFSLDDLWAARSVAVPGAVAQIAAATAMSVGVTHLWGWSFGSGLIFGLALSVASTVVLLRALEAQGTLVTRQGRLTIGWLVVEDLVMIFVLVLLPALAPSLGGTAPPDAAHAAAGGHPLWLTVAITLAKVGGFVALMLVVGKRAFPWLLRQVERTGQRDLFTLAVMALALGVAFGSAAWFGVSYALGAFFAGIVVNESDLSHRAADDLRPLQDAFAVLFFVAVGMLFDPTILVRRPLQVLAVVGIIVLGKSAVAFGIVRALRRPLGEALAVSASLAQIGEFSFILAGLGMSLGLLPPEGRDLILAGALLSITLNPLVFYLVNRAAPRPRV